MFGLIFYQGLPSDVHVNKTPETGQSTTLKWSRRKQKSTVPFVDDVQLATKNPKNIKTEKVHTLSSSALISTFFSC